MNEEIKSIIDHIPLVCFKYGRTPNEEYNTRKRWSKTPKQDLCNFKCRCKESRFFPYLHRGGQPHICTTDPSVLSTAIKGSDRLPNLLARGSKFRPEGCQLDFITSQGETLSSFLLKEVDNWLNLVHEAKGIPLSHFGKMRAEFLSELKKIESEISSEIDSDEEASSPSSVRIEYRALEPLHVRSDPNQSAESIAIIPKGGSFFVLQLKGSWCQADLDSDIRGWVLSHVNIRILAEPVSNELDVSDSISKAQRKFLDSELVLTLTDKAPGIFLLVCPRLYAEALYSEMEKPGQYEDVSDSEEVVATRLNAMVLRTGVYGANPPEKDDMPKFLQLAVVWIKYHKKKKEVCYRPLALNALNPMAPLCKAISDALIAVENALHKMHSDLILQHFGVMVDKNWICSSSDNAASRFNLVNRIESPETIKECKIVSADISNMYPSLPISMMVQVLSVVIDEVFRRAALSLGSKLKPDMLHRINTMPFQELKRLARNLKLPKSNLRLSITQIFQLRKNVVKHLADREEDRVVIQISDMRHRAKKSAPIFRKVATGVSKANFDMFKVKEHLLITKYMLKKWIVMALNNQFVTVGGKVKKQVRGLAQGKADAVRLSGIFLSFFEMSFVLRCTRKWTAATMPLGIRLMCIHSQRMVDDLWQIVPKGFDNFRHLYFDSFGSIDDFHGVYPTIAVNQSERHPLKNPIVFSTDNQGQEVPHLDFTTIINPIGKLDWKLYDKVWDIPDLCMMRKFPHRFTFLSAHVMRNTVWNALRRCDRRSSTLGYMLEAIKHDFKLRLYHGWCPHELEKLVVKFNLYTQSKGHPRIVAAFIRSMVKDAIEEFNRSTA